MSTRHVDTVAAAEADQVPVESVSVDATLTHTPDRGAPLVDEHQAVETPVAEQPVYVAPVDFRPGTEVLPPSGEKARAAANIAAIRILRRIEAEDRYATVEEQAVLGRWSGWGAAAGIFDLRKLEWASEREQLRELLDDKQWSQAQRNTLNAHYTDPAIAQAMWRAMEQAGFGGGRVLEPGCGSGTFLAHAPTSAQMVGVELDSTTASIAAALHPSAQIRNEGFELTHVPEASFTAAIGNVPFGDFRLHDPAHNPSRLSIHNHFINKALAVIAPGGYVTVLTSRFTMDAVNGRARKEIAEKADLLGAIRLPESAFSRVAGTSVVTDILVLRRREDGQEMTARTKQFLGLTYSTVYQDGRQLGLQANSYYADKSHHVLGTMELGRGQYAAEQLVVRGESGAALATQVEEALSGIVEDARRSGLALTASWANTMGPTRADFERGLTRARERGQAGTTIGALSYDPQAAEIRTWNGMEWAPVKTRGAKQTAESGALLDLRDIAVALIDTQREDQPAAERAALRVELNQRYDAYVARYGLINRFTWSKVADLTDAQHDRALDTLLAQWRISEGSKADPYDGPVPQPILAQLSDQAWVNPKTPHKLTSHLGKALRADPSFAAVMALEEFDETTMTATKAALFHTDVLGVRPGRESADTLADAVAISLDQTARIDVDRIADLLGTSVAQVQAQLPDSGTAFRGVANPNVWVPAAQYLSGNVRKKLAVAHEFAAVDERYRPNVAALTAVLPPPIRTGVEVRPGTGWIPDSDYVQFMRDTFAIPGDVSVTIEKAAGQWSIQAGYYPASTEQDMKWGLVPKPYPSATRFNFEHAEAERRGCYDAGVRKGAYGWREVLTDLLNSKPIEITKSKQYRDASGGDGLHDAATRAAQARAQRLSQEFGQWALHTDADRTERLLDRYNELFNSVVAPSYDGSARVFPGLGSSFKPYDYQRNAVARIVSEPSVLLDHVVGAGKSGTMFMGAMELKRLGLAAKPWIVVPNHIVDQVTSEALRWYPGAKVLSGAAATDADMRRLFVAQSASQDWDMVIVPMSVFVRVGVAPSTKAEFIQIQLDKLNAFDAEHDDSVKAIEKAKATLEAKLTEALDDAKRDTGLNFESSGCDYLFIDEAHNFKNLVRASHIQELACAGSDQALDLQMKLTHLRDQRRAKAIVDGIGDDEYVERVATFATGTPVANSLAELWVMQTYLRPDLLADAEVSDLDEWGAAFTETVERVELNSSGSRLRPVTRVGEYTNVGDLVAINSVFTDFVGRERVPVPLPEKNTGTNEVAVFTPPQEVLDFIADLGWRADNGDPSRPDIDNTLVIADHGRKASLDPRAAHLHLTAKEFRVDGTTRAAVVSQKMLEIWNATKDNQYLDKFGEMSPTLGGLQIGFCDRGTPKPGEWSVYQEIKDRLVAGGMDPHSIRFVHDYPKPSQKAQLFADCTNGRVSVLLGSTEKMGTGTNVQDRAVALIHVDVPWRPADLEQREGRIIRQGNQNEQVRVLNIVAERTYDTVMWQTVHKKAHYIEQLRRADRSMRRVPNLDADSVAENAALTKALATGDQRYMRQVELDSQVRDLQAQADTHFAEQRSIERDRDRLRVRVPLSERRLQLLTAAVPALQAWRDRDGFDMTIGGRRFSKRSEASAALQMSLRDAWGALKGKGLHESMPVAEIAGHTVEVVRSMTSSELFVRFESLPIANRAFDPNELYTPITTATSDQGRAARASGIMTRVENMVDDAGAELARLEYTLTEDRRRLAILENTTMSDFPDAVRLQDLSTELHVLRRELRDAENSPEALARNLARTQRLEAKGREDGWSLLLNPTPALVEDLGFEDADAMREMMAAREMEAQRNLHLQAVAESTTGRQPGPAARLIAMTTSSVHELQKNVSPARLPLDPHADTTVKQTDVGSELGN
ncbi:helicase-related protein [Antrihabitans sp. NCIMB 15449]|uniref:Helicase-related protein n=1 Tax=Antrihabitans spumae TaxID=3373370 RepID=A0ABW7JUA1_9NOCA